MLPSKHSAPKRIFIVGGVAILGIFEPQWTKLRIPPQEDRTSQARKLSEFSDSLPLSTTEKSTDFEKRPIFREGSRSGEAVVNIQFFAELKFTDERLSNSHSGR